MMFSRFVRPATVWVIATWVAATPAQIGSVSRPARVSRPSAVAPSVRLGLIGGFFTRTDPTSSLLRGSTGPSGGMSGLPRGLPLSQSRFRYSVGRRRYGVKRPAGLPMALRSTPGGVVSLRIPQPLDQRITRRIDSELRIATGFDTATNLSLPFGYTMLEAPRRTGTPGRVPERSTDAFDLFFDLRPPPAEKPKRSVGSPPVDWVRGVEQVQQERVAALGKEAVWLFRQAMGASAEDRPKLLSEAVDALRRWRMLAPHDATPCLLLVYASMARSQALSAVLYLADALRRDAKLFEKPPDLKDYFPEPDVLRDLLQTYLLGGVEGSDTAEWWALRAYCAWMLGDRGRLRDALDQMTDKPREILSQQAVRLYRNTLEASVARMAAREREANGAAP